jgi:KDO2-lipid IV(A) lauroyltransferase
MVDASLVSTTSSSDESGASSAAPTLASRALVSLLATIGRLPISARSAIGGAIGHLVGRLPLREARIASLQVQAFLPGASPSEIVPKVFENVGRSMMESLNLKPLLNPPFKNISCPQWDTITQWTKEDRPIIALTAHTGNWDLLAAYTIARGIPLATVGKEARNPSVQVALRSMREAYGIDTIWRSDKSGIKRIIGCFKERRVMAALIDQDTRVDSVYVPYFGALAKTPSALVDLGKRFNARLVSAFIVRTKGTHFEIHVEELDGSKSTEEILAQYHRNLERLVREHPDQWVWIHKRWRSDPSGTTLGTKDYLTMLERKIGSSRGK